MVAVVFLIPPQPYRARTIRVLLAVAGCLVGVTVAIAVIALQWHTFTDTVAGAAVGIGAVCALALILDVFTTPVRPTPAHHRHVRPKRHIPDAVTKINEDEWLRD